jgi:hypothetical protein
MSDVDYDQEIDEQLDSIVESVMDVWTLYADKPVDEKHVMLQKLKEMNEILQSFVGEENV